MREFATCLAIIAQANEASKRQQAAKEMANFKATASLGDKQAMMSVAAGKPKAVFTIV